MNLNIDPEWLLRMAEKEDNCITSVAGLACDLGLLRPNNEERRPTFEDDLEHLMAKNEELYRRLADGPRPRPNDEERRPMSDTSVCYRVQTQKDWFSGNPFPWEDSPVGWAAVEYANQEAESVRARHDRSDAGHALAVRVVKVTTEVMGEFPPSPTVQGPPER